VRLTANCSTEIFITNHELSDDAVPLVVKAGRCHWKTENENYNVLKTKGYHLEHNFGQVFGFDFMISDSSPAINSS